MTTEMFAMGQIGERLRTQDNRITAHPIFEVQEQKRIYGIDTDYDPKIAWLWADESVEVDARLAELAEVFYEEYGEEPEVEDCGSDECFRAKGGKETLRRVGYHEYWEYVQPFFTEAAAELYIKQNGHNHRGKLRIYASSAFRNHEWQAVREWLMRGEAPR